MNPESQKVANQIGACLRTKRREMGLSQSAVGTALGVTFQQVQKYENGKNRMGVDTLVRAARFLKVDIATFFDGGTELEEASSLFDSDVWEVAEALQRIHDPHIREGVRALVLHMADMRLGAEQPHDPEAIRTISVTPFKYYRWRKEFGGLKSDQVKRLKDLEKENERLRKAVSDLTLEKLVLKEAAS